MKNFIEYEEKVYNLDDTLPPPLYRLYNENVEILFHAEYRYGTYFRIKSISYDNKTYVSDRYHYKYIPLIRETTYKIFKEKGLYDYGRNSFVFHKDMEKFNNEKKTETLSQFLGRKLLPRI